MGKWYVTNITISLSANHSEGTFWGNSERRHFRGFCVPGTEPPSLPVFSASPGASSDPSSGRHSSRARMTCSGVWVTGVGPPRERLSPAASGHPSPHCRSQSVVIAQDRAPLSSTCHHGLARISLLCRPRGALPRGAGG